MTIKCKFCNDTKQEPGVPGVCVWCDVPEASTVRRYTAVELRFATNSAGDYVSEADYDALASKLAEQQQGDPVGMLYRIDEKVVMQVVGDPHIKDGMPVYTHPEAGEVERLRAELEVTKKLYAEVCQASYDFGAMQTQLAERDTLLRDLGIEPYGMRDMYSSLEKDAERYRLLRERMCVDDFPSPHPDWSTPSEVESKRIDALCDAALERKP